MITEINIALMVERWMHVRRAYHVREICSSNLRVQVLHIGAGSGGQR